MTLLERIDHYLSNELSADEVAELERDLQQKPELQDLLSSIDMARRTIRTQAIRNEVYQVHRDFISGYRQQTHDQEPDGPPAQVMPLHDHQTDRRRSFGWVVRIAATVLLAMVGYSGYQFATVDRQVVYDGIFVDYRLPTMRGIGSPQSVLDSLYQAGDYAAVVQQLNTVAPQQQQPRHYFLRAMSHLKLRQYKAAIEQFRVLQSANRQSAAPSFEPESDYYQALAELGAGNYEQAYARLELIRNNPRHLFHENVSRSDLWKIKLLALR